MIQVVLRDFDGTETLLDRDPPLPRVIHTSEADSGTEFLATHHYIRSSEVDPEGRPVYRESDL